MIRGMSRGSLRTSATSPASTATSVPAPIATLTSAVRGAGASFTPSCTPRVCHARPGRRAPVSLMNMMSGRVLNCGSDGRVAVVRLFARRVPLVFGLTVVAVMMLRGRREVVLAVLMILCVVAHVWSPRSHRARDRNAPLVSGVQRRRQCDEHGGHSEDQPPECQLRDPDRRRRPDAAAVRRSGRTRRQLYPPVTTMPESAVSLRSNTRP